MVRKKQLPARIAPQIDKARTESGLYYRQQNIPAAISAALSGWELIPDPKQELDYYPQSMSRSLVRMHVELGDKIGAKKWIKIMAEMYDDPNHEDHLVLMTEAEAMMALGDRERAYYVFGRIHEIYGDAGFKGEQRKHLDFYKQEKTKRDG